MFKQYREIKKGEHYVVAVDTAMGANDYTAAQYLCREHLDVPLVYHSRDTTKLFLPSLAKSLEKIYDLTGQRAIVAIERQNGGAILMDEIAARNILGKYTIFMMPATGSGQQYQDTSRAGFDTNSATRGSMLAALKSVVDSKVLRIYDKDTVSEMFSFVKVQSSSLWRAQAERGKHDDLMMALAIAYQMHLLEPMPVTTQDMSSLISQLPSNDELFSDGFY